MALSQSVEESLKEAEQSLRNALAYAARQERPMVCSVIADLISKIESMQETDSILDKLEKRKPGDTGMFGKIFNDKSKRNRKFLNYFYSETLKYISKGRTPMTLPKNGKKLTKIEEESMEIALKEAGIRAIHPERMEALADSMVEKLKGQVKGHASNTKGWRTCSPLND